MLDGQQPLWKRSIVFKEGGLRRHHKSNGATMESAITVKGQATIPKAIREHLRLKPGDRVKFFVHPDGSVVLLPKLPAAALRGIIKSRLSAACDHRQDDRGRC